MTELRWSGLEANAVTSWGISLTHKFMLKLTLWGVCRVYNSSGSSFPTSVTNSTLWRDTWPNEIRGERRGTKHHRETLKLQAPQASGGLGTWVFHRDSSGKIVTVQQKGQKAYQSRSKLAKTTQSNQIFFYSRYFSLVVRAIVQLLECFSGMHKAMGSFPSMA